MLLGVGAGYASLEIPLLVLLQLDSVRIGNVFLERIACSVHVLQLVDVTQRMLATLYRSCGRDPCDINCDTFG